VEVDDLPGIAHPVQHDGAPVDHVRAIVQMERSDGDVSKALDVEVVRLQVHVRRLRPVSTNLREDLLKIVLNLGATVRTTGYPARVKYRSIVGEEAAELVPI